jgi:hypothetical protein
MAIVPKHISVYLHVIPLPKNFSVYLRYATYMLNAFRSAEHLTEYKEKYFRTVLCDTTGEVEGEGG